MGLLLIGCVRNAYRTFRYMKHDALFEEQHRAGLSAPCVHFHGVRWQLMAHLPSTGPSHHVQLDSRSKMAPILGSAAVAAVLVGSAQAFAVSESRCLMSEQLGGSLNYTFDRKPIVAYGDMFTMDA